MIAKLFAGLILIAVAVAGWQLGSEMSRTGLAILLGATLTLIPAMAVVLLAKNAPQHTQDATPVQTHAEPPQQPQRPVIAATAAITMRPERWAVVPTFLLESEVIIHDN